MKTISILLTILVIGGYAAFTVWSPLGVKGDGVIKSEERTIADFSKVEAAGAYEIHWSKGKSALTLSTDQNLLPLVSTVVNDGTLKIDSKDNLRPTKDIKITISSDSLSEAEMSGANRFTASGVSGSNLKLGATGASTYDVGGSATKFTVNLTGASTLRGKLLDVQSATLTLNGASTVNLEGAVLDMAAELSGACTLHTKSFNAQTATLTLNGASTANVAVANSLDVTITGASTVTYSGNPASVKQKISGASTLQHR